jgi:hypothetical protein
VEDGMLLTPEVIEAFKKSPYWPCVLWEYLDDIYCCEKSKDDDGYELYRFFSGAFNSSSPYCPAGYSSDVEWGGFISREAMDSIIKFVMANSTEGIDVH